MTCLPIDFCRAPWREKYIDEETPVCNRWFIFGERDGTVDICDGDNDILIHVPREKAEKIIASRNAFVDVLITELNGSIFGR